MRFNHAITVPSPKVETSGKGEFAGDLDGLLSIDVHTRPGMRISTSLEQDASEASQRRE